MKTKDVVVELREALAKGYTSGSLYKQALTEIQSLRKMLQWCAEQTWEGGDINWGDFQEAMVKAGFYALVPATETFKEEHGEDEMYVTVWSPLAGEQDK